MTSLIHRLPLWKLPLIGRWFDRSARIAVVRIDGVIGTGGGGFNSPQMVSFQKVEGLLEQAFNRKGIKAVAIVVNSPGGWPVQCSLIGSHIRRLATEKKLPVHAFVEDLAASGGYWIAAAADDVFADPASAVGSIGIISVGFGFHELIQRYGIERRLYTAGTRKSMLDAFTPADPDDVARLSRMQADVHQLFIDHVRDRRGERLSGDPEEMFSGEVFLAGRALEMGLIDGLGHVKPILQEKYGEFVKLERVMERRGWLRAQLGLDRPGMDGTLVAGVMAAIEARLGWARFGL